MKILHTSDWHFGRNIENVSREEEQTAFSKELCLIAQKENVDLVLVAGDIFDTYNPPVWAEKLYYDTLKNLSQLGIGVVVISVNHDSPQGLCSAKSLAQINGIVMCEYPYSVAKTGKYGDNLEIINSGKGWFELKLKNGEKAVVAALSYPSESRIADVIEFSTTEENIKKDYNKRLSEILSNLCSNFKNDAANILVSHIYINGGKPSDSERNFQLGGAYAVMSETIPHACDYVALGHLHRPQKINECLSPAYYSGSPIAYSFSEAGYIKSVNVVDIKNHKADIKAVPVTSGRTLVSFAAKSVDDAVNWCRQNKDNNKIWAELKIYSQTPITSDQIKLIKDTCPGVVAIRPEIERQEKDTTAIEKRLVKPLEESFSDFYQLKMGTQMPENIKKAFEGLRGDN